VLAVGRTLGAALTGPKPLLWPYQTHTRAKHLLLRTYLDAWLPIIGSSFPRARLIDGFAGPGRYSTGEDGSPILMLKTFLHHLRRPTIPIEFIFIETRQDRFDYLCDELDAISHRLPLNVEVYPLHGSYADQLKQFLATRAGVARPATFAFIDPFGFSDTETDVTSEFLGFPHCEALIYVPTGKIARLGPNAKSMQDALTTLFGGQTWVPALAVDGPERRRQALRSAFLDVLHRHWKFTLTFEVDPDVNNNEYELFFATSEERGYERMNDAMWKVDPESGQRFHHDSSHDNAALITLLPDYSGLRAGLIQHFGPAWFSYAQARHFTLHSARMRGIHLNQVLREGENATSLEVSRPYGVRRGSYTDGTKMRFRQVSPPPERPEQTLLDLSG
jgi:three-Cys-motif partner protein